MTLSAVLLSFLPDSLIMFLSVVLQNDVSAAEPAELHSRRRHLLPAAEALGPEAAQTESRRYTAHRESLVKLCAPETSFSAAALSPSLCLHR